MPHNSKKKNPAPSTGTSIAARIACGILAIAIAAAVIRDVLIGQFQSKRGSFIAYREAEPQLFWLMIFVMLAMAAAFGYVAFRKETNAKK